MNGSRTKDKSGTCGGVASGQSEGLSCNIAPVYIDEYMFVTIWSDQRQLSYNKRRLINNQRKGANGVNRKSRTIIDE